VKYVVKSGDIQGYNVKLFIFRCENLRWRHAGEIQRQRENQQFPEDPAERIDVDVVVVVEATMEEEANPGIDPALPSGHLEVGRPTMYLRPGHPPDPHLPWECPVCTSGQECWDRECTWDTYISPLKRTNGGR